MGRCTRRNLGLMLAASLAPALRQAGAAATRWEEIDSAVARALGAAALPGAVFLIHHRGRIVYHKAFGHRALRPEYEAMTLDTMFDLASLTKPIATASSIMALVQDGRLRLNDSASEYWPEFKQGGKDRVTIRHLLTHTSGLAAWAPYHRELHAPDSNSPLGFREQVLSRIAGRKLDHEPGARFVYSDLGFMTLGQIVHQVSGLPIDQYARRRIFSPLGMTETGYNPPAELKPRIAPTTERGGAFLRGAVHDENAFISGGVAGHAGLFSTAADLSRFAKMMLSSDFAAKEDYPLSPYTIRQMTVPHTAPGLPRRGLGWDIDSGYSHVRGDLLPPGSFGHTGFTGTFLWVDPFSQTFIIGLSNRVHPDGKGNPLRLWAQVSNITAGMVQPGSLPPRPALQPLP